MHSPHDSQVRRGLRHIWTACERNFALRTFPYAGSDPFILIEPHFHMHNLHASFFNVSYEFSILTPYRVPNLPADLVFFLLLCVLPWLYHQNFSLISFPFSIAISLYNLSVPMSGVKLRSSALLIHRLPGWKSQSVLSGDALLIQDGSSIIEPPISTAVMKLARSS